MTGWGRLRVGVVVAVAAAAAAGAQAATAAPAPDPAEHTAAAQVAVAPPGEKWGAAGVVYRYYARYGYRFQPLLSFGRLNVVVSAHDRVGARRLASALVGRGVRRGDALYWEYDFPYGGPVPWTSGFVQAVAAQALARTAMLVGDAAFLGAADAAFAALRRGLLMPLGGGSWVREYGFSNEAILNAQLQSLISLESYAQVADTAAARRVAAAFKVATLDLLRRFDLGCSSRYALGGAAATRAYQAYHADLLGRLAETHTEPIWSELYARWRGCLA